MGIHPYRATVPFFSIGVSSWGKNWLSETLLATIHFLYLNLPLEGVFVSEGSTKITKAVSLHIKWWKPWRCAHKPLDRFYPDTYSYMWGVLSFRCLICILLYRMITKYICTNKATKEVPQSQSSCTYQLSFCCWNHFWYWKSCWHQSGEDTGFSSNPIACFVCNCIWIKCCLNCVLLRHLHIIQNTFLFYDHNCWLMCYAVLQIRRGNRDNLGIITGSNISP